MSVTYEKELEGNYASLPPTCDFCGKKFDNVRSLFPIYKKEGNYYINEYPYKKSKPGKVLPAYVSCQECIDKIRE